MPYKEFIIPKKYKLSEVAELCGILPSKIRYWTNIFNLKIKRNSNNFRIYTEKDLKFFLLLKKEIDKKNYTLKGIKEIIIPEILKKL